MYGAVDIGGTKTLLGVFNDKANLVSCYRIATPASYSSFLEALAKLVVENSTPSLVITAAGVPARLDRANGRAVAFGNLNWGEVPIAADLERILKCPIRIENDAKLAGLYEADQLKGSYHRVLYVTVSTGIGGGFFIDGKPEAATRDAEFGHMLLEYRAKLLPWEEFASGRAIARRFGKPASDIAPDDHDAWYWVARNIAIGLIDLIATLTPEVVVLGGGVGANLPKFRDRLMEQLKLYESPLFPLPPVESAKHPEDGVLYGAYMLARGSND